MEKLTPSCVARKAEIWSESGRVKSPVCNVAGRLSKREFVWLYSFMRKILAQPLALLWKGQSPNQCFTITSAHLCKQMSHTPTHTHTHAQKDLPAHALTRLTPHYRAFLLHIKSEKERLNCWAILSVSKPIKARGVRDCDILWIHWQMRVFHLVCLPQFSSHTRCCSVFCVAPVFWHSENNNHSSAAQTNISCQKHPTRANTPHTGNEWMVVERSHFTEKI